MIDKINKSWSKVVAAFAALLAFGSGALAYINRENDHWLIFVIVKENWHLVAPLAPLLLVVFFGALLGRNFLLPKFTEIGFILAFELTRGRFFRAGLVVLVTVAQGISVGLLICGLLFAGFVVAREYKYLSVDLASKSLYEAVRKDIRAGRLVSAYRKAKPFSDRFAEDSHFDDLVLTMDSRRTSSAQLSAVAKKARQEGRLATAFLVSHAAFKTWPGEGFSKELYFNGIDSLAKSSDRYDTLARICANEDFEAAQQFLEQNPELLLDAPLPKGSQINLRGAGKELCTTSMNIDVLYGDYWKKADEN